MNLSELVAALPEDDRRTMPVGSLHRLWTVSEISAQVGLAYLAIWIRQWFTSAEASKRQLMETNLRVALKLFHRLGYLRGALAKLGQGAAHLPHLLPQQVADTLGRLQFDAPPMHFPLIREVVRNEFGRGAGEVFVNFQKEAFAAASIGQVHRAWLRSGEAVAVKIQYPGIARTIDADFRNLSALLLPLRLGMDWGSVKAQFEEVRRMLNQEVDYLQEAESTRCAGALFRPEDGIVVPQVYGEYSGRRVLTTGLLQGVHLPEYLAGHPSQASRNAFGTKIYVAWKRMFYAFMPYADLHPGNFLFMEDGRLGLLDFGCVQHYGPEEREITMLADRMSFEDASLMPEVVRRVCGVTEGDAALPDYLRMMAESREWMMEPLSTPGPFDFGDEAHFQKGIDWFSRTVQKRMTRANPMYVYMNRSIFGLKAMLFRLRAQVDVHEVIRQERPRSSPLAKGR